MGFKTDKEWRAAIQRAVKRRAEGTNSKRLELLAETIVNMGLAGDLGAIQEIGNRLDGKPHQTQDTNVTMGASEAFFQLLKLISDERGSQTTAVADSVDGEQAEPAEVRH